MKQLGPLCVQIAALGGQGGGVLAEWLGEAAAQAGYPAQVTSIPGVAQRTGATTYYFEMHPDKNPAQKPVFSLFPDGDGLDLMVAMEPLEATRALSLGLITDRTTVITAIDRIYSNIEKSVAGDGIVPSETLFEALESSAGKVIRLDISSLAAKPETPGNATMFGAMAASKLLPFGVVDFESAIKAGGIAVESSLVDFSNGYQALAKTGASEDDASQTSFQYNPAPSGFDGQIAALPNDLRPLVGHTLARLVDYQNEDYARLYLSRLERWFTEGRQVDGALINEVARRLGAWMTYEDVIRVAQLKTRPGRLARIRGEIGVDQDTPFSVTDFLKPGREEMASLMPPFIGNWLMKDSDPNSKWGIAIKLKSNTFWGYGMLKLLAGQRGRRHKSWRYQHEQAAIEQWLSCVDAAEKTDLQLAMTTAELALMARGYGAVRRRGLSALDQLFNKWNEKLASKPDDLKEKLKMMLHMARNAPDKVCGT